MNPNADQSPQAIQPNAPTPPPVETVVAPQTPGFTPPNKPSIFSSKWTIVGIVLLFLIPIVLALLYFFVLKGNSNQESQAIPTPMPIATEAPLPTLAATDSPTPTIEASPTPSVTATVSASPTP